jgi:hypothetical protein
VRGAAAFVWDFLVGDDPLVLVLVVAGLGITAAVGSWWPLPLVVIGALAASVLRVRPPT